MKITWIGQAGLLMEISGKVIIIDPYLSDSVEKIEPQNKRRVPVDKSLLSVKPDVIILTHNHLDHTDPETLQNYLNEDSTVTVLASYNAWQTARKIGGYRNNFVMFNRGTTWTEGNIEFTAVYAEHSDTYAIGVVIKAEGKTLYVSGDTLYNKTLLSDLGEFKFDCVFLPINGRGNNMNMKEAKTLCDTLGCLAVPLHCGLFDSIDMNDFEYSNKIVPEFYKEIKIF
jgi:L-ascorbate 6-phosphate lactonase